jgi:hypothetical protein
MDMSAHGPPQKCLKTLIISPYWGLAEILGPGWHTAPKRIVTGPRWALWPDRVRVPDIRRPLLLPVILRQSPTNQSSCCTDPFLALSNHPRKSTAPGAWLDGGTRGGCFSQDRGDFARRAHAAHRAGPRDHRMARRSDHRGSHAQSRRSLSRTRVSHQQQWQASLAQNASEHGILARAPTARFGALTPNLALQSPK